MRGPSDLFTTLEGCPVCRYVYDREEGYLLIATWAFSYGLGALVALGLYLFMEYGLNASLARMLWTILPIVMLVNLLTARHARALWLAVDHFLDPQACWRDDGDDGDGVATCPAPPMEGPMFSGK